MHPMHHEPYVVHDVVHHVLRQGEETTKTIDKTQIESGKRTPKAIFSRIAVILEYIENLIKFD
jgi:hypothetical protein